VNLLSGDFDMFPLIEEALEKNWKVNLWSWKVNKLVDFQQIFEIKKIVSVAQSEDLKLKNEAIEKEAEQRRQKEEKKRLDKETKKQEINKSLKENWGWIAGGTATLVGLITYTIKKIKR